MAKRLVVHVSFKDGTVEDFNTDYLDYTEHFIKLTDVDDVSKEKPVDKGHVALAIDTVNRLEMRWL